MRGLTVSIEKYVQIIILLHEKARKKTQIIPINNRCAICHCKTSIE